MAPVLQILTSAYRFFNAFGLPWKSGDYHRTTFQFNPSSMLPADAKPASMPDEYSMKVLHVRDARSHEKIFIPTADAQTQSIVFPPADVDTVRNIPLSYYSGDNF